MNDERKIHRERLRRNPKFKAARHEFLKRFHDYPHGVWTDKLIEALDRFVTEWSIAPIDPDSKDFETEPLYYYQQVGKDGAFLIRVYPWTKEKEVIEEFRRIRSNLQPEKKAQEDDETIKKVIDLVHKGTSFQDIGREVFREKLDKQELSELEVDQRLDQLINLFAKEEDLSEEEAGDKAMAKLKTEDIYLNLRRPYNPGERTRALEKKARQIYELMRPGLV